MRNPEHEGALELDSPVEDDSTSGTFRTVVPAGEYRFAVNSLTISESKKLQCPMVILELGIYALDDTEFKNELTTVMDRLPRHTRTEWKVSQFFIAIGDRKHGQLYRPKWKEVPGACGRCKLTIDTFEKRDHTQGEGNNLDTYLDPDAQTQPDRQEQPPQAEPEPDTNKPIVF